MKTVEQNELMLSSYFFFQEKKNTNVFFSLMFFCSVNSCMFTVTEIFLCLFFFFFSSFCITVDAVYAMAHALHKIMKENCKDLEFSQCDALQPGTDLDLTIFILFLK